MGDASQGLEATLRSLVAQELERALRGASGAGGAGESGGQAGASREGRSQGGGSGGLSPERLAQVKALLAEAEPQSGGGRGSHRAPSPLRRRSVRTHAAARTKGEESPGLLLAQAQAEFTEELSANLRKLKQVINESRQIAQKMETVLGMQGSGGKDGGGSTS